MQLAAAASVAGHVLVSVKLPAFVPPSDIPIPVNVDVPVLVRVTVCAALVVAICVVGKAMPVLESDACGATPDPVMATVCGEPVALSETESVPVAEPTAAGVNPTEILQLVPAASVELQADVSL
jgi:hypothetical protein